MSWQQLADIARMNAAEAQYWREMPPTACPNDGEPLKPGPDGRLYCPFDGWTDRSVWK